MLKYMKETRTVEILCPNCKELINFQIPEELLKTEHSRYPFTFRYIHGQPAHSVTLYIDKSGDIRGTEFNDSITLSKNVIQTLLKQEIGSRTPNITKNETGEEQKFPNNFVPKIYNQTIQQAKQKFDTFQYQEALTLLINFDQIQTLSLEEQLAYFLLEIDLFYSLSWYEYALDAAKWVYQKSENINNRLVMLDASLAIGKASLMLGNLEICYEMIIRCEKLFAQIKDQPEDILGKRKLIFHFNKGRYFWQIGELNKALEEAIKQLDLSQKYGRKQDIALGYHCVSLYYLESGIFQKSLEFSKKALNISTVLKNKMQMARSLNNIGEVYRFQGELDLALENYQTSSILNKELNDIREMSINFANIGLIYYEKGLLKKAEESILKSLYTLEKISDNVFLAELNLILLRINLDKDNYKEAQSYLEQIRVINEKTSLLRIKYRHTLGKALLLKHKWDLRSIIEARIRLDELVGEKMVESELRILALVNICTLLVRELEITNDDIIRDEITPYITELLNVALESKNYPLIVKIYVLQAKLELLNFNIEEVNPLFEKVLKMAKEHQLFKLYDKITMDYDRFIRDIDTWRELKKNNSPIKEMFKYISFKEDLNSIH